MWFALELMGAVFGRRADSVHGSNPSTPFRYQSRFYSRGVRTSCALTVLLPFHTFCSGGKSDHDDRPRVCSGCVRCLERLISAAVCTPIHVCHFIGHTPFLVAVAGYTCYRDSANNPQCSLRSIYPRSDDGLPESQRERVKRCRFWFELSPKGESAWDCPIWT